MAEFKFEAPPKKRPWSADPVLWGPWQGAWAVSDVDGVPFLAPLTREDAMAIAAAGGTDSEESASPELAGER